MSYFLRQVVRILGVMLFLAAVLVVKVTYNARQEFARGEDAYTYGAYNAAITHYERAIKWYTPLNATVRQAVERLWQLGTEAETRGDWRLALEAYQSLRASLYAVQSFYMPYQSWIPKSEERIASLLAKTKAGEAPKADTLAQDTARFAMQLQRPVGPHLGWSILLEIGFLGQSAPDGRVEAGPAGAALELPFGLEQRQGAARADEGPLAMLAQQGA